MTEVKRMGLNEVLNVSFAVVVTPEDIDDIMVSALEGGITHWCKEAEVVGEYLGEYGSDQISRGGVLKLRAWGSNEVYELTKEKFLKGLTEYLKTPGMELEPDVSGNRMRLNTGQIDSPGADAIIQYAIFDEIVRD